MRFGYFSGRILPTKSAAEFSQVGRSKVRTWPPPSLIACVSFSLLACVRYHSSHVRVRTPCLWVLRDFSPLFTPRPLTMKASIKHNIVTPLKLLILRKKNLVCKVLTMHEACSTDEQYSRSWEQGVKNTTAKISLSR